MLDFVSKVRSLSGTHVISVGQAGYIIKSASGQLLAIDLYLSECVERIEGNAGFKRLLPQILDPRDLVFDAVICTHPHVDHFDVDAVPQMIANGANLFCSIGCQSLVQQLHMEYFNHRISYVKPGDIRKCGDFEIQFVNCDHGESAPDAVGVVIKVDKKRIYETGDTCLRLDYMSEIPRPIDVLIAPINGMYGNMDAKDVIRLSKELEPSVVIPCHYGMFVSHGGNLKEFYDIAKEENVPFLIMQQGESYKVL